VAASAVHRYCVIVWMNSGFHCSPIDRDRSAREPRGSAASLGHETIPDYTRFPLPAKAAPPAALNWAPRFWSCSSSLRRLSPCYKRL
jgi:hypothetical protein